MDRVNSQIDKIVQTTVDTILITGETGTGKELVARSLHILSPRARKPFITINCNAVPHDLLENELFGHMRGAFTNAFESRKGLVEQAEGGTLFLDEIGDMDVGLQGKLLRFLEDRSLRRLGGQNEIEVDVRVIAATNKDLLGAVRNGEFRTDLYHRLNLVNIHIPPLRERKEDINILFDYFLEKFKKKHHKVIDGIANDARDLLNNYAWPGNVRELKNLIEKIVILESEFNRISIDSLRINLGPWENIKKPSQAFSMEEIFAQEDFSFKNALNSLARQMIEKAMKESNHNKSRAAKILRMDRSTLNYHIKNLAIDSN